MAETDGSVPKPSTVSVYGVDHSPWVQAVLLGLQERGIDYRTRSIPPLAVFLRSGILMPAASIDGGPWMLDSERILVALGFAEVPREVRRELTVAFTRCAAHRRDDMLDFWRRFGLVREEEPSWARRHWNFFWRAFAAFYYFWVLTVARRAVGPSTPEQSVQHFSALQKRLDPEAEYFGGERPDTVDLQLFGIVQMLGSIPGPPLTVLREDPALEPLRSWIARMQRRFENHPGRHVVWDCRDFWGSRGARPRSSRELAASWRARHCQDGPETHESRSFQSLHDESSPRTTSAVRSHRRLC